MIGQIFFMLLLLEERVNDSFNKTKQFQANSNNGFLSSERFLRWSCEIYGLHLLINLGDIQRCLHSTRVDANEIVNSVMMNNPKTVDNTNGLLIDIDKRDLNEIVVEDIYVPSTVRRVIWKKIGCLSVCLHRGQKNIILVDDCH